jgi:hypothetical protein
MSRFNELVDIFNVEEDDENMEAIKALVLDEHKKSVEKRINAMLRLWEQALDEKILPTYNDFIEERLTELKANILVKSYPYQNTYYSKNRKKKLRKQGLRDEVNQRPYTYATHLFNDDPDDINDIDEDDEWTPLEKQIRNRMNKDIFDDGEFI